MADFICLAMAPQYTENNNMDTPLTVTQQQATNSFRRSLGTSTLFGRRSSRSNTGSSITTRPTSNSSILINEQESQQGPIHIRIVPSIENPSRSLVFNIIERDLEVGRIIKIGRFTDRSSIQNHISFKSKVVSRSHCEIWLNNEGKVQLKDTKSSSGTFINHVRLSPANTESIPVEIRDGDLVQLGVDYQGGYEEIYRSVKMRFEVNRSKQHSRPISYSMSAFNNLRNLTSLQQQEQQVINTSMCQVIDASSVCHNNNNNDVQVEECCICLYALAPFQALFVAPCSHSYHFKCIRPLFDSYPGFQCPICRTYSDLDASVAIEADEVIEKFGLGKSSTIKTAAAATEANELIVSPTIHGSLIIPSTTTTTELPLSTTLVACTTSLSGIVLSNNEQGVSQDILNNNAGDHQATNTVLQQQDDNQQQQQQQQQQQDINGNNNTTANSGSRNANNLVEKIIKMALFSNEKKRKKRTTNGSDNSCSNSSSSDEDLSEAFFDTPCSSSSSPPSSSSHNTSLLQPMLSRQSTQYNALDEIVEESSTSGY